MHLTENDYRCVVQNLKLSKKFQIANAIKGIYIVLNQYGKTI